MTNDNSTIGHGCVACGGGECTGNCIRKYAVFGVAALGISGALLLLAMFVSELKAFQFIGRDVPGEMTTINVSGEGEAYAVPDTALISFSVTEESKTAADARKTVSEKVDATLAFLKKSGVEEKDIKTTGFNLYPKYEWQETKIMCITYPCPQPPGKQVLTGFEVTQSFEVKIRKIDDAGTIVGGLADNGATNMSGPTFTVDDADGVKAKARREAIAKAKAKAEELAKELNVKLVRIVSFNEGSDYSIYNYARGGMEMKAMSADGGAPVPAAMPVGENKFISNVNITYEIR